MTELQNNTTEQAYLERQGNLLIQGLGLIDFLKICLLLDIITAKRFGDGLLVQISLLSALILSIVPTYLAWQKKYQASVNLYAFNSIVLTFAISLLITWWYPIVFSLHLLTATFIMMIFGERRAQIYSAIVAGIHVITIFLQWENLIPLNPYDLNNSTRVAFLSILLLMNGSLIYIFLRGASFATREAIEGTRKVQISNHMLNSEVEQRRSLTTELQEERKLLQQRVAERTADLEIAAQRKDEFLANMSHELRTPLNTILGRTQALQLGIYGGLTDRQVQSIDGIEASGQHLLSLINDILDVSKIVAGEMTVKLEEVNITEVCEEILDNIRPLAQEKPLDLHIEYHHSTTTIFAEKRRIKQILLNLLSNAVKFTPEGKSIGLSVAESEEEKSVIFIVWDKGIGIPRDKQDQLFQPFVQVENGLDRKYVGTGLGLALVKQLVDLHNGHVELESFEGEGSNFVISLPIDPREISDSDPKLHDSIPNQTQKLPTQETILQPTQSPQ